MSHFLSLTIQYLFQNDIKLGDFGLARLLDTQSFLAHTCCGTPYYISPELCRGEAYDSKADMWALGCVIYELAGLKRPFSGPNLHAVVMNICMTEPASLQRASRGTVSTELSVIVDRMLCKDHASRISAAECLQEPYFQKHSQRLKQERGLSEEVPEDKFKALADDFESGFREASLAFGEAFFVDPSDAYILDDFGQIKHVEEGTPRGRSAPISVDGFEEERVLELSGGALAAQAPAYTREVYELLSHSDPGMRETGLTALDSMLSPSEGVKDLGIKTLQTALLVLNRVSKEEAVANTAAASLSRIREAGKLLLRVDVPEAVTCKSEVSGRSVTKFVLKVRIGDAELDIPDTLRCHEVQRRYSDFDSLRSLILKDVGPDIDTIENEAAFPPKKVFGSFAPGFVEERRQGLGDWLTNFLLLESACCHPACANFLGVP